MSIRTKLAIVAGGFFLPIALLMYFFIITRNEKIDFAQQELNGNVYLRPLRQLMQHIPQHKAVMHRALQGNPSAQIQSRSSLEAIEQALLTLQKVEQQYGKAMTSQQQYQQLLGSWKAVRLAVHGTMPVSADSSNALHKKLIADVRSYIAHIGDKSNLILDPDLDSYYLMDLTLINLPEQQDLLYQVTELAETIFAKGQRTDDEKIRMIVLLGLLNSNLDKCANDYRVAFENNAAQNLKPVLEAPSQRALATVRDFTSYLDTEITKNAISTTASARVPDMLAKSEKALQASFDMWDAGVYRLDALLQARMKATQYDKMLNLAIVGLALFLTILVGGLIMRNILKSIKILSSAAKRVSAGDLNTHVTLNTSDEMGSLAMSFNAMVESLQTYFEEVTKEQEESARLAREAEQTAQRITSEQQYLEDSVQRMLVEMERFAEGNLTVHLDANRDDVIATLFHNFNQAIASIGRIVRQVQESTVSTADALAEIEDISQVLAVATRKRSEQASEISKSMSIMVETIQENSQAATRTAEAANRNEQAAQESARVLAQMSQKIHEVNNVIASSLKTIENLGDSGSEINKVVDVIEEIAEQTNLLALNAAIEAARAGDQGRGFAVVADEVRKLAERTRQATKQIKVTVQGINHKTSDAVKVIRRSNDEMNKGIALVEQTSDVLNYIAQCSQEVLQMTEQIMLTSNKQASESKIASENVADISRTSRESAQADAQLMHLIQESHQRMEGLLTLVQTFVIENQLTSGSPHTSTSKFRHSELEEKAPVPLLGNKPAGSHRPHVSQQSQSSPMTPDKGTSLANPTWNHRMTPPQSLGSPAAQSMKPIAPPPPTAPPAL
jgi:methyl-accepting chemotaxis protein